MFLSEADVGPSMMPLGAGRGDREIWGHVAMGVTPEVPARARTQRFWDLAPLQHGDMGGILQAEPSHSAAPLQHQIPLEKTDVTSSLLP